MKNDKNIIVRALDEHYEELASQKVLRDMLGVSI